MLSPAFNDDLAIIPFILNEYNGIFQFVLDKKFYFL